MVGNYRLLITLRYGYVHELVKVELAEGNYAKAGDIYLSHGKYLSTNLSPPSHGV